MKPSWDDAPEWANWLAMDEDGIWYWFENEPYITKISDIGCWYVSSGKSKIINSIDGWCESLEQRK